MPRVKRGVGHIEGAMSLIDQNPKEQTRNVASNELLPTTRRNCKWTNGQMSSIYFRNPNLIRFVTFNLFSK